MNKKVLAATSVLVLGMVAAVWISKNRTAPAVAASTSSVENTFIGASKCRACHENFYQLWSTSHHGLAMQSFTAEFAAKELQPQREDVVVRDVHYRAEINGTNSFVVERGPKGEHRYPILHVMGGKNVYYFLTPVERGKLQVLPVAYDLQRKQWYDTTASAMRHFRENPDEALDWRERPLTFNSSCFNCHVSQLSKNYDLGSDTYHTTFEAGINCEACHGPAAEHMKLFESLGKEGAKNPPKDYKLIRMTTMTHEQRNDTCAPCHAKMVPLTDSYKPAEPYFDHFDLGTLEDRDFYPDARDLGENYTFTLWRTSPCAKSGQLDCVHCHTSSGRNRFKGEQENNACLPCHKTEVENVAAHSHHPAGSKGSSCVACHMPTTEFARMRRSDHSMLPPSPAATLEFKSPNACNICHTDKDAAWADGFVRKWYPRDYQEPQLRLARLIDAGRKRDWSKLPQILEYIGSPGRDEIRAASLLRMLENCPDENKWPVILKSLKNDASPLVRARAAEALQENRSNEAMAALAVATRDPVRLVRIRAAAAFAGYPVEYLDAADRESVSKATAEFEAMHTSRPDDGASYYNLGNFHMARRDYKQALSAFDTATKLQPDLFAAHVNAALAENALGHNDLAEARLRQAIKLDATNAVANLNLGLLMGELGRVKEAESAFREALKSDPRSAIAAYNLGVIAAQDKRVGEAINLCRQAAEAAPQDPKYAYTLAFFQNQSGQQNDAIGTLKRLLEGRPAYPAAYALLGEILLQQRKPEEAAKVYRMAVENRSLGERERAEFTSRLNAMGKQ